MVCRNEKLAKKAQVTEHFEMFFVKDGAISGFPYDAG
jgi:hypothetical protein